MISLLNYLRRIYGQIELSCCHARLVEFCKNFIFFPVLNSGTCRYGSGGCLWIEIFKRYWPFRGALGIIRTDKTNTIKRRNSKVNYVKQTGVIDIANIYRRHCRLLIRRLLIQNYVFASVSGFIEKVLLVFITIPLTW